MLATLEGYKETVRRARQRPRAVRASALVLRWRSMACSPSPPCTARTARACARLDQTLVVVGYDEGDAEDRVFIAVTPPEPEPVEQHVAAGGITSIGMREFMWLPDGR